MLGTRSCRSMESTATRLCSMGSRFVPVRPFDALLPSVAPFRRSYFLLCAISLFEHTARARGSRLSRHILLKYHCPPPSYLLRFDRVLMCVAPSRLHSLRLSGLTNGSILPREAFA